MLEQVDPDLASGRSAGVASRSTWGWYDVRVCCGVLVTVRATSHAFWPDLKRLLPPRTSRLLGEGTRLAYSVAWAGDLREGTHQLYRDDECILRTPDTGTLLSVLQSDAEWQVAMRAEGYTFAHAGAVAVSDSAIVLPGASGAGKSTLVTKLLARGCQYYSDEYAVLDQVGRLHAFPCALKLKVGPRGIRSVDPQVLGASCGQKPRPVRMLAFPTYVPGQHVCIEDLSPSQGALYLLQHIPSARLRPATALKAAATTASAATCLRILHGDSDAAAESLLARLTSRGCP